MSEAVDVLVCGFGPAGAGAAIAAHDAGARVVVVEKTAAGGGNAVHSGGFLVVLDGPAAVDHLDALCFGKTPRDVLAAYAEGTVALPAWLEGLGADLPTCDPAHFGGMLPSWPHLPGRGQVTYRQQRPAPDARPGIALWRVLEAAVHARGIPVETETTVAALLQDDGGPAAGGGGDGAAGSGRITGAVLDGPGGRRTVATGAVVLTTGGFEADAELVDAHLSLPLVPVGHLANTGDGLRLARAAGASDWHMGAFFGWFAFRHRDFAAAFPIDVHAPSHLMVDADGHRFADETGWEVHDKVRSATAFLPRRANRPVLPLWVLFDEPARKAGPLNGVVGTPNDHAWSADNAEEVRRGWIHRADTPAALADAIGVDPAVLSATLDAYAAACAAGRDELFGRDPATLAPLAPGPLYAVEVVPGVATASGGPRRDPDGRVLGPGGAPVPGLYAAGANGSIWAHLTEHGGGLTDALVFGRRAGAHATAVVLQP